MSLVTRSSFTAFVFAAAFPLLAQEAAPAKPKKAPEPQVYDEQADGHKQVADALAKAKRDNQRVIIQWGANWCGWCKWLAGTMHSDQDLAHELLYEYQLVHIDVGRFDKHKDLAKELGADFKAIPYLTILDADGKALVQQNTEPFEINTADKHGHDPAKVLALLKEHEAKPLDATEVLIAGRAAAKAAGKRVFLHFGAPWCGWCHRLEDWMARPEIAAVLGKEFVDVKIDIDRMTGGKDVYAQQLAAAGVEASGIPWFVFLGEDGKLLANATGPTGNVGFPYQPEEVEHFGAMLHAAKANLTAEEIQGLLRSLTENRERDEAKKKAAAAPKQDGQ
ncbi:MAG: thioredoxin family protein [Planctomycetota bacterium]